MTAFRIKPPTGNGVSSANGARRSHTASSRIRTPRTRNAFSDSCSVLAAHESPGLPESRSDPASGSPPQSNSATKTSPGRALRILPGWPHDFTRRPSPAPVTKVGTALPDYSNYRSSSGAGYRSGQYLPVNNRQPFSPAYCTSAPKIRASGAFSRFGIYRAELDANGWLAAVILGAFAAAFHRFYGFWTHYSPRSAFQVKSLIILDKAGPPQAEKSFYTDRSQRGTAGYGECCGPQPRRSSGVSSV